MKRSALFAALWLILNGTFTSAQNIAPASSRPLRVGVIQSLSGIAAEDGRTVVEALQLAADELNKGGKRVELFVEDDQTVPRYALAAYQKLKDHENVDAIIGATWDFTSNVLFAPAGRDSLVIMNTSTLPECLLLDDAKGYAFSNSIPATEDAAPFAGYLAREGIKSVTLVYVSNAWGELQRKIYREIAEKHGVQVIAEHQSPSWDNNDWRVLLPRIGVAGPDLVALLVNKDDVELFLRRSAELDLKPRFFATKNAFHKFQTSTNPALYENLCLSYPLAQLANEVPFIEAYQARFKREPRVYADGSYDALNLLAAAFEKAQREKLPLRDALAKSEHHGLAGHYKFSPTRSFGTGSASLVCIKGGKMSSHRASDGAYETIIGSSGS